MRTQLIAMEVSLQETPDQLHKAVCKGSIPLRSDALCLHIEDELSVYGVPLRWAITSVDQATQRAHVEAVVTLLD
ncbi:MAG: hypothetical protein AAGC93_14820 [Cyanobacteria bacterium P01_F01_bin.53]